MIARRNFPAALALLSNALPLFTSCHHSRNDQASERCDHRCTTRNATRPADAASRSRRRSPAERGGEAPAAASAADAQGRFSGAVSALEPPIATASDTDAARVRRGSRQTARLCSGAPSEQPPRARRRRRGRSAARSSSRARASATDAQSWNAVASVRLANRAVARRTRTRRALECACVRFQT